MAWRKSPPELIALFDAAIPTDARVERRKMFGYPAAFTNGHLFAGLHQESLILRLDESDCAKLCEAGKAGPFEPMAGRRMRNYVALAPAVLADRKVLGRMIARALAHTAALPPKGPKRPSRTKRNTN